MTDQAHPFAGLPLGTFGTVLADPPWLINLRSSKGEHKSPQAQYACMDLAAIKALPVADLCLPDACCIMWGTAPMLPQAIATMAAWGFRYSSAGAWAKRTKLDKNWQMGTGFVYRSAAEFWIYGSRGRPVLRSRSIRNLIVAPVREHSRKPEQMRQNIEAHMPGPYVELFARHTAPGWSVWGNETDKFSEAA